MNLLQKWYKKNEEFDLNLLFIDFSKIPLVTNEKIPHTGNTRPSCTVKTVNTVKNGQNGQNGQKRSTTGKTGQNRSNTVKEKVKKTVKNGQKR